MIDVLARTVDHLLFHAKLTMQSSLRVSLNLEMDLGNKNIYIINLLLKELIFLLYIYNQN